MSRGCCSVGRLLLGALGTVLTVGVVALGAPSGATAAEPTPSLSVDDVGITEETGTTATATFTVTLSAASASVVTVAYATADGTAKAPEDYGTRSGDLMIPPGAMTAAVSVPVAGDALDEDPETFKLALSVPSGATLVDDQGEATITDDDSEPALSVSPTSAVEGTGATPSAAEFEVTLSAPSGRLVTAQYETLAGTAQEVVTTGSVTSGDYVGRTGAISFAPGEITKTVSVALRTDAENEPDETFALRLQPAPGNATLLVATNSATIINDDQTLSVGNVDVTEDTGTVAQASFAVVLSGPSSVAVTVKYTTADASAKASSGATGDYQFRTGTLTFAPGEVTKTVDVPVTGDATDEDLETFQLQLSVSTNATILDGIGVATITDDDAPPTISIGDASITEGTGSNKFLVFTVSLSAASSRFISFNADTAAGTAVEITGSGPNISGDYVPKNGGAPTQMSPGLTTATVSISIRADTEDEVDETLEVVLSNVDPARATLATPDDARGLGTIIDDDGPTVSISDTTVAAEGATGASTPATLTVTLSAVSPQPIKVNYASSNDTAVAGQDYDALASGQSLTIAPGQKTATVATVVRGDDLDENDEKYRVTLTAPVNATLLDAVGVVTVTDDDAAPTVQVAGVTVTEGTGTTTTASLKVSLSAASGRTLLAGYATKDGTAVAGSDYQQSAELLTFNPGDTAKTITISIAPDADVEEDEAFEVFVFNAAAGADGVRPVTVTITDDDLTDATRPLLSVDDVTVREGDAGAAREAVFTVALDRPLARRVTVNYNVSPGSATAPEDFRAASGTLTFAPRERTKSITVTTVGDTALEFNQDFRVELADPVNAKLLDASGLGIIIDDDVGGGPLVIGAGSLAGKPVDRVRLRDLMCAAGKGAAAPKCAGLAVAWQAATPGTVDVTVTGVARAGKAKRVRLIPMVDVAVQIKKAGQGRFVARRAASRPTERVAASVRKAKVASVRVTVSFTNRFGGQESVNRELRLLLRR